MKHKFKKKLSRKSFLKVFKNLSRKYSINFTKSEAYVYMHHKYLKKSLLM